MRLACNKWKVTLACLKLLEAPEKEADAKIARMVDGAVETKGDLCLRTATLESSLTAENDLCVWLEKDRVDGVCEGKGIFVDQQEAYDVVTGQLREREEALRNVSLILAAAIS